MWNKTCMVKLEGQLEDLCIGFTLKDDPDSCRCGLEKIESSRLNLFIRPLKITGFKFLTKSLG
jgi:hypothetical protein